MLCYIKQTVIPIFKVIIISVPIPLLATRLFSLNYGIYSLLISLLALICVVPTIFIVGLTMHERILLKEMVVKKIPFINKKIK